jgi:hypothetical protein
VSLGGVLSGVAQRAAGCWFRWEPREGEPVAALVEIVRTIRIVSMVLNDAVLRYT